MAKETNYEKIQRMNSAREIDPELVKASYIDERTCDTSGATWETIRKIGKDRYLSCYSIIDWFMDGVDVNISEVSGDITANRNDSSASNSAYATTTAGTISIAREFTITPTQSGRFIQSVQEMYMMNAISKSKGNYIKSFMDGKFHVQTILRNTETGFEIIVTDLEVKWTTLGDPFMIDYNADEPSFTMSGTVERDPIIEFKGEFPENFAKPKGFKEITFDTDNMQVSNVSITGIEVNDPSNYLMKNDIKFRITNSEDEAVIEGSHNVDEPIDISSLEEGEYTLHLGLPIAGDTKNMAATYWTFSEKIYVSAEESSKVITHYIDSNGESISAPTEFVGKVGDAYVTVPQEIEDYTLKANFMPENEKGKFKKDIVDVYYIYTQNLK